MVQKIKRLEDLRRAARLVREARGTHIATRYALYEIAPAYTESGYYGRDIPERRVRVTSGTREEIKDFISRHEPDYGKSFEVRLEELYEKTTVTRKWHMGDMVVDLTRLAD